MELADASMSDEFNSEDNSKMEESKEMKTDKTTETAEKDADKYMKTTFRNQLGIYLTMDELGCKIDLGELPYPVPEGEHLISFSKIKERVMSTLLPEFVRFSELQIACHSISQFQFFIDEYPMKVYFPLFSRDVDIQNEKERQTLYMLCWELFYSQLEQLLLNQKKEAIELEK